MRYFYPLLLIGAFILASCDSDAPTTTQQRNLNPVDWTTNRVSLKADHFFILASADTFYANVDSVEVHSSPGDSTYCSLEITWQEHGVEMRLYIYFYADSLNWWSDEFRTYNGEQNAQWFYYFGEFFLSPLGEAFSGDFEFESDTSGVGTTGTVHMEGLRLQAFLNP